MQYQPSFRSQFIFKRTYNRPLDTEGTVFETFEQTIGRVIGHQRWLWETAKGKMKGESTAPLNTNEEAELEELRQIMLVREAFLSGRTLWLGGTDVGKQFHATQFNCFSGSTKFVTDNGVVQFKDHIGKTVNVLTENGEFLPAEVKHFGSQPLCKVVLKPSKKTNLRLIYEVTEDHRWVLQDGTQTTSLKVGDKVKSSKYSLYDVNSQQYIDGFAHGVVFGDGSEHVSYKNGTRRFYVRLCGEKSEITNQLLKATNHTNICYPPSQDGDPGLTFASQFDMKAVPEEKEADYIAGFIEGWLYCDGHKKLNTESFNLDTQDEQAANWLVDNMVYAGYVPVGFHINNKDTNYGKRSAPLNRVSMRKDTEFFYVEDVEFIREDDVYCVVEPITNTFTLAGSVLTGNCSFLQVKTVHDVVDAFHSLLLGVGVGFEPITGVLNGFAKPVEIQVVRSNRIGRGNDNNQEQFYTVDGKKYWKLIVGDSGIAWGKAAGKILAMKKPVDVVVLDFTEIRPGGKPLRGFGWISSGDEQISEAFYFVAKLLSDKAGKLLTRMDILDVMNWLGTALSSRRSAEIALVPAEDPEAEAFAFAKKDYWTTGNKQRGQSNNSLIFYHKPTKRELRGIFSQMLEAGGSEPGFINGAAARKKAPWFRGVNPCAEILLGDKNHCNLVTIDLGKFNGREEDLERVFYIVGRANYRQTCVNLKDGILQESWHELNEFLRLTGVGCAGIVKWEHHKNPEKLQQLNKWAHIGVDSMADELNLPRSKAVCTVKPDGTLGKVMDTTEGGHKPLSKYILNHVIISKASPLFELAANSGYRYFQHPFDTTSAVVALPVCFEDVEFDTIEKEGKTLEVNLESAVDQLERYKLWVNNYADHNVSITVSYSPDETESIVEWLFKNWDYFIGVSFLLRADPTKTAEDLGYAYLPQQPVTKEEYYEYVKNLKEVNLDDVFVNSLEALDNDCSSGVCPIR